MRTAGAIIGRDERSKITPSIAVAKRLVDVFGLTLAYLVDDEEGDSVGAGRLILARSQPGARRDKLPILIYKYINSHYD